MSDLTPILVIVAIALGVGGFFLFQRQRKKDEPAPVSAPVPVAAPAPDVAALQAALKQAIDKLHASTPAVPVAAPVAPPVPAVALQPDGTIPAAPVPAPIQISPAPPPVAQENDATYLAVFPPWHPSNPANLGKRAATQAPAGSWMSAREGDVQGFIGGYNPKAMYDNVTGNPAWAHADNPPYRWDGSRWVRP